MPAPKRPRREPTHDWDRIHLYVAWHAQEVYEILRPINLFGETAAERAATTGIAERTLARKADLFDAQGMASLFEHTRAGTRDQTSPEDGVHIPLTILANGSAPSAGFSRWPVTSA